MIAFQKYCQLHQGKIMGFTIFIGVLSLISVILLCLILFSGGEMYNFKEPLVMQAIMLPVGFVLLLLIHRIFNLYIQGYFYKPEVLTVYRAIAKIAIAFALVIKPAFFILLELYTKRDTDGLTVVYMAHTDFLLAIVAYALNLVAGVTKMSRELEQEQELTI